MISSMMLMMMMIIIMIVLLLVKSHLVLIADLEDSVLSVAQSLQTFLSGQFLHLVLPIFVQPFSDLDNFQNIRILSESFFTSSSLCFRRNARLPLRLWENKKDSNLKVCSICEQNLTSISCLHFPEEYSQWGWLCLWETLSCERNMKRGFFPLQNMKSVKSRIWEIHCTRSAGVIM